MLQAQVDHFGLKGRQRANVAYLALQQKFVHPAKWGNWVRQKIDFTDTVV